MDAAVHVALRREVHNCPRPMIRKQLAHWRAVADVTPDEGVARVSFDRRQILKVARVG